jgi:hypothetical protein
MAKEITGGRRCWMQGKMFVPTFHCMLPICGEEFSAEVECDPYGWIFALIILCIPVHLILIILSVIGLIGVFPTSACP